MLEILLLCWICQKIKVAALSRKRKPRLFTVMTVIVWFVFELIGCLVALNSGVLGYSIYGYAFLFAAIGALICYIFTKLFPMGTYEIPVTVSGDGRLPGAQMMPTQSNVIVVRDKSFSGVAASFEIVLNGHSLGKIKNGEQFSATTEYAQNIIVAKNGLYGNSSKPFIFSVSPGTTAEIHFKGGKFQPKICTGCVQMTAESASSYSAHAGLQQ